MTEAMTELALFELLSLECCVNSYGTAIYHNRDGRLHRLYGPAVEYPDGAREWYQNGQLHRLDGPAIERPDGRREWYQNGRLHRMDGPAVEHEDCSREWWQNGLLHRLDGPEIECPDGASAWYINGKALTEAEWQQVASMGNASMGAV